MPLGPGGLDANGIWLFGEDDSEALASDLLNLGMDSVSDVIAALPTPANPAILQVVSTTKTDTFSTTSTSYTDITGLSATITPSSASSKIMVSATVNSGRAGGLPTFQLVRDSIAIGVGDAAGSRTRASMSNYPGGDSIGVQLTTVAVQFLDSPSTTSATTYKIQARTESSTLYVNRSGTDTDSATYPRTVSTITLMEVAG